MAGNRAGLGGLAAPRHDRFARWPQGAARFLLALLAGLILLAALPTQPAPAPPPLAPEKRLAEPAARASAEATDDRDLLLYRTIIARVQAGEDYYAVAVDEQRRNSYPVTPGLTVRLPTLAMLGALLGPAGLTVLRGLLFVAMLVAAWRRLGVEPEGPARRPMALALLAAGIASGLGARYDVLHEVWAGQLIALSFMLHRPGPAQQGARHGQGGWGWSWLAAALALALRELALPYVLFMGAHAAWRGARREALAWAGLALAFAAALLLHLHLAAAQVHPGDPASPSWLAIKGMAGLLHKVNQSTFLVRFPIWLSGPLVVLALFGWAGWRTPLGAAGFVLVLGYACAFMIVGRDNNFYWGLVITPLLFMGAAFLPVALPSLWRAAELRPRRPRMLHA